MKRLVIELNDFASARVREIASAQGVSCRVLLHKAIFEVIGLGNTPIDKIMGENDDDTEESKSRPKTPA